MNLYGYGRGGPVGMSDPYGLWGIRFGSFQIGSGDPWLHFTSDSWSHVGKGAAATADGVIPFWDPFADYDIYDADDPDYKISRTMGVVARETALLAAVVKLPPGSSWRLWGRNPVKYEIGSATLSKTVYDSMIAAIGTNATALEKFAWLAKNGYVGWRMLASAFLAVRTVSTGPTPGGWLGAMFLFVEGLIDLMSSGSAIQSAPTGPKPNSSPSVISGGNTPSSLYPSGLLIGGGGPGGVGGCR